MNLGSARLFEPATSLGLVLRLRGREILCPFFHIQTLGGGSLSQTWWAETVMKVLIVENSEPMRRVIRSLLNDLVEEFVECIDGSEALAAYNQHQPDLVLMDLKMKGVDGIEATRQITRAFPDARVIIVSQYDDATLWQAARSAGAEEMVSKSDLFPIRRILGEK